MVLAAEENCQHADLLFLLVHLKPVDGAVYCSVPQPREHILVQRAAMRRHAELICPRANGVDRAMTPDSAYGKARTRAEHEWG